MIIKAQPGALNAPLPPSSHFEIEQEIGVFVKVTSKTDGSVVFARFRGSEQTAKRDTFDNPGGSQLQITVT